MAQNQQSQDFQALPTYKETTTQNATWVSVVLTRTDSDGSVSQTFFIAKK